MFLSARNLVFSNFEIHYNIMRFLFCTILLSLALTHAFAQDTYNSSGTKRGYRHKQQKGYDPAKLVMGGGLNLGYSNNFANVGISPKVGYKLTDFLAVGVGIGYQFYKSPWAISVNDKVLYDRANIVFPGIWAKCRVFDPFYLSTDMEYNIVSIKRENSYIDGSGNLAYRNEKLTKSMFCGLVGVGIRQDIGGRVSGTFELMYDVLQASEFSPYYKQLVYRAGIFVGL